MLAKQKHVIISVGWLLKKLHGACFSVLFVGLAMLGQCTSMSHAQGTRNAPAVRDPQAIAALKNAVNAMGGTEAWKNIHSALTSGSYTVNGGSDALPFVWTDEWTDQSKMKRDNTGTDGVRHVYLQDNSTTASSQDIQHSSFGPRLSRMHHAKFDKTSALVLHAPAAALLLVIKDDSYSITQANTPSSSISTEQLAGPSLLDKTDIICVRITKRRSTQTAQTHIEMCFSAASSLPVYASVGLPNLLDPSRLWPETVIYGEFQQSGNLLLPKTVLTVDPGKREKRFSFHSSSWNPTLSANTFSEVTK